MNTSIKKIVVRFILISCAIILIIFGSYWIHLPNQLTLNNLETLEQVFKEYKIENEFSILPNASYIVPEFLSCAICDGKSSSQCSIKMAIHISNNVSSRQHSQNHIFSIFRSYFLGSAIWLRYDEKQIQRLYLGVYANYEKYHGLESVCEGLLNKTCSNLSKEDIIYLDAWLQGRDWYANRLKNDPEEFNKRSNYLSKICSH